MKTRTRVPLVRRFSPVPDSPAESDEQQFEAGFNYSSPLTWEDIDKEYRSVILAEAGAGKTCEMRARAKYVGDEGRLRVLHPDRGHRKRLRTILRGRRCRFVPAVACRAE